MEEKNRDVRMEFNRAIINYNIEKRKKMKQSDIDPSVNQSHVNNVAAGKSTNKQLRKKIEKFIKRWG